MKKYLNPTGRLLKNDKRKGVSVPRPRLPAVERTDFVNHVSIFFSQSVRIFLCQSFFCNNLFDKQLGFLRNQT